MYCAKHQYKGLPECKECRIEDLEKQLRSVMPRGEIFNLLKEVESDERLHYKSVDVYTNAPLALEQLTLETKSDVLRKILKMPFCEHNKDTGRWEEIVKTKE
jgi:hypothetical protein